MDWDETRVRVSGGNGTKELVSMDLPNEQLRFYSLGGLMAMWNTDSCCEVK